MLGRIMPASNHTFLDPARRRGRAVRLQAELGGASAVGLHRRHPRRPRVRRLGGLATTSAGTSYPRRCCATVPPARAWCSCGWSRGGARGRSRPGRHRPRGCRAARAPARAGRDRRPRRAGRAGARGLRAAAPDGGLRPRHQQHRPQGRPRAADARTGTATASTTASASTSRTSCARCCGAGPASALAPTETRRGRVRCSTACAGDLREQLEDLLTVREVDAVDRRCERLLRTGAVPGAGRRLALDPVAAVLRPGRIGSAACVPGPHPTPGRLPGGVRGPAVRVFDSSTRALRDVDARPTAPPGCTSAASRRTTPPTWATPRPTSPSTCSTAPGARAGHDVRYVQNVTDVDDPLLERADATGEDWVELAERETELFRTDMEALRVLPPDAYVGAVEAIPLIVPMIEDLQAGRSVRRRPTTSDGRPLLLGHPRPGLRRGLRLDPRADARGLRRPRGRPRPSRQEGPARLPGLAGRATRRAGLGLAVRPRPARAGTSSARRSPATTSAPADRRAGRRQRPGLPAPRDERLRGAGRRPDAAVRAGLRARRDGRARRREDVEVQGQPGAGLEAARERASTRW